MVSKYKIVNILGKIGEVSSTNITLYEGEEELVMIIIGIVFVLAIVYLLLSESWLKKKYDIQRKEAIFVKFVNKIHLVMELILVAIAMIGVFVFSKEGIYSHYWVFGFFIAIMLVRTIMEFIYERERREYILELNYVMTFVVLFMIVIVLG